MYNSYTVKKGENLLQISNKLGTTVDKLIAINGLDKEEYVYENQMLLFPDDHYETILTKIGDTINELVSSYNLDFAKLSSLNKNILLKEDQIIIMEK